ncbi:MerR family transcriptional regulator [Nocardiopsis sp. MG754419]|uniref:MerR family transcriptional regulator n=1 Tax=Nocardiopsis sp. MG754419 TaxID=2259865 RepID=UPI001BA57245|nr:MerR family transcriptional regulator [Nocardiopsis sp. MG754419]MBR8740788.1 hypothetical protein [Nocardiopsis sp. MG754419]
MSLFIKDFSEISDLSPQTLRFYHSEGLLVPATVDEETGYRYYEVDQIQRALLIMELREAGMSVKDVRQALDAPDTAVELLRVHTETLHRRRTTEDEAMRTAHELLTSWPEVEHTERPETTVLSAFAPTVAVDQRAGRPDRYDWGEVAAVAAKTADELRTLAEEHGATVAGTPWFTAALETDEQKKNSLTLEGPHWSVKLPISASPGVLTALNKRVDVQTIVARKELSVFVSGRHSAAKYMATALQLVDRAPEGYFASSAESRHLLHGDGIETAVPLRLLDEVEIDDEEEEGDESRAFPRR